MIQLADQAALARLRAVWGDQPVIAGWDHLDRVMRLWFVEPSRLEHLPVSGPLAVGLDDA